MNTTTEEHLVIAACADNAGLRADQFLAGRLPHFSRSIIAKYIKAGAITSEGGRSVKPSQLVTGTEQFVFTQPKVAVSTMAAENIALDIVFSDEHIAVINKPAGLIIHPGAGVPGGTLCNALLHHFPGMAIGNTERPGIVHRLDKDTTGLVVIAKTEMAHRVLSEAFKERRVEKYYLAVCYGEIFQSSFTLKTGHARHPHNRLRFTTKIAVEKCQGKNVRLAHTHFTLQKSIGGITLVKAELHTGRTHQIRAHLADIDHPILGDEIYGGKRLPSSRVPEVLRQLISNLKGHALHAETLIFDHPITQERLHFSAPLPETLAHIVHYFQ